MVWTDYRGVNWEMDTQLDSTETTATETVTNSVGYRYSTTLYLTSHNNSRLRPDSVSCDSMKDAVGFEAAMAGILVMFGATEVAAPAMAGAAGIDYLWGRYAMGCPM